MRCWDGHADALGLTLRVCEMGRPPHLPKFGEERTGAHREDRSAPHPPRRAPARGPGPSGERASERAGREEGPEVDRTARWACAPPGPVCPGPSRPVRPTMAPAAGRRVRGLWRACNWLMGAFFALAAFVQVSAPGRAGAAGGEPGLGLQAGCGVDRPTSGVAEAGPVWAGRELGLMLGEPPPSLG